jgi:hypothetical protein
LRSTPAPTGAASGPVFCPWVYKPAFLQGWDVKMNQVVTEKFAGIDASKDTLDVSIDTDEKSLHVSCVSHPG